MIGKAPVRLGIPHKPGFVAEGHVLDIDQRLLLVLLVPHLEAGVPGIGQNRADCARGPRRAGTMLISFPVVGGRAGNVVRGQPLGDGEDAYAGEVFGEDALPTGAVTGSACSLCRRFPSAALPGVPALPSLHGRGS